VTSTVAADLDFDKVLQLVAAHARTRVGRFLVADSGSLPAPDRAANLVRLSAQVELLLAEDGPISFAGVDGAEPWLEDGVAIPEEPADLLNLVSFARRVAAIRASLAKAPAELEELRELGQSLLDSQGLVDWAGPRLGRDGQVPDQASPELARLRRRAVRLRQRLVSELDTLRRSLGAAVTDSPHTLRRDRYCLAVRTTARSAVSGLVLDSSATGATVFVEPYAVVELNNALVETAAREAEEVRRIIAEVAAAFAAVRDGLVAALATLARLDASQARVLFGRACRGQLLTPGGDQLLLVAARHPLLDERLAGLRQAVLDEEPRQSAPRSVVPLDFSLAPGTRTLLLSGPNAGGKTVVLKTIGLMVLMAYNGIPAPVEAGSAVPEVRHLWCHIGDEQSVAADLSTFSGAMASTRELMAVADRDTLVLYDELGAGTDPLEGAALGVALLESLTERGCLTVATSHLASIALWVNDAVSMENAAMEFDEEAGRPTYLMRLGRPGRSRALEIVAALGLPGSLLERARELLGGAHLELDTWLKRLERLEAELREERLELARQQAEIAAQRGELERQGQELTAARSRQAAEHAARIEALKARAKEQLDRALAELDRAIERQARIGKRRRQQIRDQALELPAPADPDTTEGAEQAVLEPGQRVSLRGLGKLATLVEVRGSQALVTAAGKRLWLPREQIAATGEAAAEPAPAAVEVDGCDAVAAEIKLLGMDSESARAELEQYLDRAFGAGRSSVRVVHGHGTGTLRRMVREVCREHAAVHAFRHPPQHLGGRGATVIELEQGDD
jgi:DNA mismatch repair protein MutS2